LEGEDTKWAGLGTREELYYKRKKDAICLTSMGGKRVCRRGRGKWEWRERESGA